MSRSAHAAAAHGSPPRAGASTQQRLLDAAREVFARDGIARATTREIARVAHVNEVTLFRQFATKENLLTAALEDAVQHHATALHAINLDMLDLDRDLRRFALSYVETLEVHGAFFRVLFAEGRHLPESTRQRMIEVGRPLRERLLRYFEEAHRQGLLRNVPLPPAIDAFSSMLRAVLFRFPGKPVEYETAAYVEACVDLFLNGVRGPAVP